MYGIHVKSSQRTTTLTRAIFCRLTIPGGFHSLKKTFLDELEVGVEIICTSIFENQLELNVGLIMWQSTSCHRLQHSSPDVRAK